MPRRRVSSVLKGMLAEGWTGVKELSVEVVWQLREGKVELEG
jgi:hypothetical protein